MKVLVAVYLILMAWMPISNCSSLGDPYLRKKRENFYTVQLQPNYCNTSTAENWGYEFYECFIDRKYDDGGRGLEQIIDRILDHSKDCVESSKKNCRPNFKGFIIIFDKVLFEMKDYSEMYLQEIHRGRENIKDLKCIEEVTFSNYEECFKTVFDTSEQEFQNEVESAISCTNTANKQCSKVAKTSLNRMVRTVLGIENPDEEDIEDEIKPTPAPPMKWYDYILQPFVYIWNGIKSLFGW